MQVAAEHVAEVIVLLLTESVAAANRFIPPVWQEAAVQLLELIVFPEIVCVPVEFKITPTEPAAPPIPAFIILSVRIMLVPLVVIPFEELVPVFVVIVFLEH